MFSWIGCVKAGLSDPQLEKEFKDWRFLKGPSSATASCLLGHATRILNAFCCVLDDVNPLLVSIKVPLVTLPNPSALSPMRRKLRSTESLISDKEDKSDESGRKNKHLLNPSNVGFFAPQPLYVKLYDLLKSTYATCKVCIIGAVYLFFFIVNICFRTYSWILIRLPRNACQILSNLLWKC